MDFRNLKPWEGVKLPKRAIMNPNYLSLPSEWDSSVSQIEMLQRMLYNINQILTVLTAYADQMNELQAEYEDIVSKYSSLRDEIISIVDGWHVDIDNRLDAQDAKIDGYESRIDEQDRLLAVTIETQNTTIADAITRQDESIATEIAHIETRFETLRNEYLQIISDAINAYTQKQILFGLSDDGYFLAEYSDTWSDLTFNTTGYDITVPVQPEYGHLCLSY